MLRIFEPLKIRMLIHALLVLSVLCQGGFWRADSAAASQFKSAKPLFAKIAVTQDGSKVLSVAFDESKGTGHGYDTLCADTNFDGRFDDSEIDVAYAGIGKGGPAVLHFHRVKLSLPFSPHTKEFSRIRVYQFWCTNSKLLHGEPGKFWVDPFIPVNAESTESLSACCHLRTDLKTYTNLGDAVRMGFSSAQRFK